MEKKQGIQNVFLNTLRKEKEQVKIFTVKGGYLTGVIIGFDDFCVVIDDTKVQNLIYKHAISTIMPTKLSSIIFNNGRE